MAAKKPTPSSLTNRESPGQFEPSSADLNIFLRVAELGTFSAVARERDVPASHVSRAIDRLEQDSAVRLMNRSTHGLTVTPEGELILAHARRMSDSMDELSAQLDQRAGAPSGLVRMSVSQVLADQLVVPSLPDLLERYPDLRIEINAADRMVDLPTEGIDLAIRTNIVTNDSLVARRVGEHGRALYAAPHYLDIFGTPEKPEDLRRHRCIAHASSGALNHWDFKVGRKMMSVSVDGHRINNTAIALTMVRHGVGIARLTTMIVDPAVEAGEIVPVLDDYRDPTRWPVFVVMMPDRRRLPKIRVCVDHFARLFAKLG